MMKYIAFIPLLTAFLALQPFAVGQGTSNITLSNSSVHIMVGTYDGTVAEVKYTINLESGTAGKTHVTISNLSALSMDGITVNASMLPELPPFSGLIIIAASPKVKPGNYYLSLSATGEDPTAENIILPISVTLEPTTSVQSTLTTTIATTTIAQAQAQQTSNSSSAIYTIAITGIIIATIIVGVAYRMRKKPNTTN